jgi:hypothetical protein
LSARVCYIERQDRGAILRGVRLIGRSSDESWSAPREVDPIEVNASRDAATWIADHLGSRLGGKQIDRLCLDVDGAVCSWIDSAAAASGSLRAVIDRDSAFDDGDMFGAGGEEGGAGRFPALPNEMGYQALGEWAGQAKPRVPASGRSAVLAVPEVAARTLIDSLDEAGVQVGSCVTLWQAIAGAWAPDTGAAPAGGSNGVVAENSPLVAAVLCMPGERVVWAWVRGGVPVAAGSFRTRAGARPVASAAESFLLTEGTDDEAHDPHHPGEAGEGGEFGLGGRLAAEWLAWSAQIGTFPSRVTWIGPLRKGNMSSGDDTIAGAGLEPQSIAEAVRRAAPDASVDVIDDDDPVGLTLRRLAERLDDGPRSLESADAQLLGLSNRPGRVHRAMYQWIALFLVAASIAIGAIAWSFWQERAEAEARITQVRGNIRELLVAGAPELVNESPDILPLKLRDRRDSMRRPGTVEIPAPDPVLRELETLSIVLGKPAYELEFIDISSFAVTFKVRVNSTKDYEELQQELINIGGSSVRWNSINPRPNRDKIDVNGSGMWRDNDSPEGDS